jgi:hypothetical protein
MSNEIEPPGRSPIDPAKSDIDAIGHALERVQTYLMWIAEHRASFEAERATDPESAENELRYLEDATHQAARYFLRLMDLILAGYTIDPNKRLPRGLGCVAFRRHVQIVEEAERKRLDELLRKPDLPE